MSGAILVFGLVAALLAAAMAYLITREEMDHHYTGGNRPHREGLRSAAAAGLFFAALAVLLAVAVPHAVS